MTVKQKTGQLIRSTRIPFVVLVFCVLLLKPCFVQASEIDTEPWNLRVTSDLSVYSAKVTISWDVPGGVSPADYSIYINGSERYVSGTNSFSFQDMAPNTVYQVMVKARDSEGYQYEKSETITISTGYRRSLVVGEGEAYSDIQTAINASGPGDVILVKDGHYTGSFSITAKNAGSADQWITLMAEGDNAHIYGNLTLKADFYRIAGFDLYALQEAATPSGYELYKEGAKVNGITVSADHIQLVGLRIRDAFNYAIRTSGDDIYVADNYIKNTCSGMAIFGSNSIYERNEIEAIGTYNHLRKNDDCDYFRVFGINQTIRQNYCHGVVEGEHLQGAHVDFVQSYDVNQDVARNIMIEGNLVYGYIGQGLMLSNGKYPESHYLSDWTVRNNIFVGFHSWAVNAGTTTGSVPGMVIVNNLFIGRTEPDLALNGPWSRGLLGSAVIQNNIIMNSETGYGAKHGAVLLAGGHNLLYNVPKAEENDWDIIGKDPMFVDMANGDYHLRPDSPAIDAGIANDALTDMAGNPRSFGKGIDIGPYEFMGVREEQAAERVTLSNKALVMGAGDVKTLSAEISPFYTTDTELRWESRNASVIAVDADGVITALSTGTATVTAWVKGREVYDTCEITVKDLHDFRGVSFSPEVLTFDVNQLTYELSIPYDCESLRLLPEYISGSLTVNGKPVKNGEYSDRIAMNYGRNTISLVYVNGADEEKRYTIILQRVAYRWWEAARDFSEIQGEKGWYYRMFNGNKYIDMQWSELNRAWIYSANFGCEVKQSEMKPSYKKDVERAWKAPYDGEITITGKAWKVNRDGNGVNVTIKRNDEVLWGPHYITTEEQEHNLVTNVVEGDYISFVVDAAGKSRSEAVSWNPKITMKETAAETERIELRSKVLLLEKDDIHTIIATLVPERPLHRELAWSSSDTSVASIDEAGTVTAHSVGTTIITVRVLGTALSEEIEVRVLRSWTASKGFGSVQGENHWYYYMLEDGVYKELTWSEQYEQWLQGSSYGCSIALNRQQPAKGQDAVRVWEAPSNGCVSIRGEVVLRRADGDGIVATIRKNDTVLWEPALISGTESVNHYVYADVKEGDRIYFSTNANIESTVDRTLWDPTITYVDVQIMEGDLNSDGSLDEKDLTYVAINLGKSGVGTAQASDWAAVQKADLNKDGTINIVDLATVARLQR